MALTDGLISAYKLDETSGDVIDSHGTNDGTNNGATRGATGKDGNAFDFDGYDDYVDLGKSPNELFSSGGFSISGWLKPDSFDDWQAFYNIGGTYFFYCLIGNNGDIVYKINSNAGSASSVVSLDTWHHISVTWDGSDLRLYVDGDLKDTQSDSEVLPNMNLFIGARNTGGDRNFNGKIDEVYIWDRALTSSEISDLASGSFYPFSVSATYSANPLTLSLSKQEPDFRLKVQSVDLNSNIAFKKVSIIVKEPQRPLFPFSVTQSIGTGEIRKDRWKLNDRTFGTG